MSMHVGYEADFLLYIHDRKVFNPQVAPSNARLSSFGFHERHTEWKRWVEVVRTLTLVDWRSESGHSPIDLFSGFEDERLKKDG